jgi:tryptophan synthase alpha chain
MPVSRLSARFAAARAEGRAAFVAYVMGGDPDAATTDRILDALVAGGADVIELGFPFTDPMADGPAIQRAALRALASGTTLASILDTAARFRARHPDVALIVMGYLNPIEAMGPEVFAARAAQAGVDGAIVVDVPPEEAAELASAMDAQALALIRLATPTTDAARLPAVVKGVSGFVYVVSVAGITGDKAIATGDIAGLVASVQQASGLPVAVGFGIRTPEAAAATARIADGVVVGSAIVDVIAAAHDAGEDPAPAAAAFTRTLVDAVRAARA